MFSQRLRGFGLWQPLLHPTQTRRIAGSGEVGSGYIVENGLHPGKNVHGWRRWPAAGRRGLDATGTRPMRERERHDLLPAANVGGAKVPQPLRELVSSAPG